MDALIQAHSLRSSDGGEVPPARISRKGSKTRAGRNRLLNREALDGRTITAKIFDRLVEAIHADMGGSDQLSAMEQRLIDAFSGASVLVDHLNAKIISGAAIDAATVQMYAASVSAMVRVARRLGISRRAKPVMDLDTFLVLRRRERGEPPEGIVE
jgi:hypothetical protein